MIVYTEYNDIHETSFEIHIDNKVEPNYIIIKYPIKVSYDLLVILDYIYRL